MKRRRYTVLVLTVVVALIGLTGALTGCEQILGTDVGNGGEPAADTVIDIAQIPGVTAPAGDETPVTSITETDQYTGTVSWEPWDDPFAYETVYTATITLTAKSGYTLTGVTENFFTVAGVDTVTHDADSGVVTAVFPQTGDSPPNVIDIAAIPGVAAPAGGATPVTSITETEQYTGTVSWDPADDPFEYETEYTATITLTAKSGYTLTGVTENFFAVPGADTVTHDADSGVVAAVFPQTNPVVYAIGDTGPAGGLIFYIDEADDHDWTYLEVAPQSTEWEAKEWGDYETEIGGDAQLTGIGDGRAATDAIVSHMEGKSITDTAAQLCAELEHGGYGDWFLPSKDELDAIWHNIADGGTGGFEDRWYWSSSEDSSDEAWTQEFSDNGPKHSFLKHYELRVRAVRAF